MPRATTNKSLRPDDPKAVLRRRAVAEGETDAPSRAAGASGQPAHRPRRPGRAASLLGASQTTRSQRWRNPAAGAPSKRRGVLAKGSRTGRNRSRG